MKKLTAVIWAMFGFATLMVPLNGQAISGENVFEGNLPRSAEIGFSTRTVDGASTFDSPALVVGDVSPRSAAINAGLQAGDVLKALNGEAFRAAIDMEEALGNLPGSKEMSLEIERRGQTLTIKYTPPSVPLENIPGLDTVYGVLNSSTGLTLRTILTSPENMEGKLPGILLSDWTSCDSTEVPLHRQRGWLNLVRGVAQRSNAVFLRIDKPGVGDSLGSCSELDIDTTIAYQKEGLELLRQHPDVDPAKLFVFGQSLGSIIAPLVAEGEGVLGIFGFNVGASTWFERMLFFERKQRELSGAPAREIDADMKVLTTFYFHYLVEQKSPEEIIAENPEMARVWAEEVSYNSRTKHYGRPIAFHHQMQQKNFAAAWVNSNAHVLALFGEFDQFEGVDAAETVVNAVNNARPGTAKLVIFPNMNHQAELYPSRKAASRGGSKMIGAGLLVEEIVIWLKQVQRKGPVQ